MTTTALPKSMLDAADISAITQLILIERESRDLGRWNSMRACFHPDSVVRISWFTGNGPAFVDGSIDMAKRGMLAKHRLGPMLVRLNGDRAVISFNGIIDIPTKVNGVEAMLSSHARFMYRAERRAGVWKIFGFDAVYVRDELVATIPGQTLIVSPEQIARFRPSYRMLSYALTLTGYTPNTELPGDDRPETARALEAELFGWAGVTP